MTYTRACGKCGKLFSSSTACGNAYCKRCHRLYMRERRAEKGMWAFTYKGGKCADCGFDEPIFDCYDFHHLDPSEKEHGISQLLSGGWKKLHREIDKTVMLCKVCHARRHYHIRKEQDHGQDD